MCVSVEARIADQTSSEPSIAAWESEAGHFERYAYGPGRRGRDPVHVHADVQICLSLNFPGRYRSGRWKTVLPAAAPRAA